MPNVLLVGAVGQGNPGDEALCTAFLGALASHEVVVASADPAGTSHRHGVPSVASDAWSIARAVAAVDAVVVGGGTIFKSLHPTTRRRPVGLLANAAALVAGARSLRKPVALVGVGAGELRGSRSRRLARWIVRHADLVVLRDEESAAVLAGAGVPPPFWIGADPAWVLARPGDGAVPATEPGTVTVALSHLAGDDRLFADLADAIAPLRERHAVRVQPWQVGAGGRDGAVARRLADRLGGGVVLLDPPGDLGDAAATFAGDQLVVGLRFHALVAAAQARTRFLAVSHEPKLAGLSRRLGQLSVPAHATSDVLGASVIRALETEPPAAAAIAAEVAAARHTFDLLRLLLDGGDLDEPSRLAALPLSAGSGTW